MYRLPPFVSETEGPQHTAWRGGLGLTWACPMLSPGRRNHAPCLARDRDPMPSSSSSNRVCSFAFPVRGCPRILRQPRVTRRVRDGTRAALGSNSDREIRTGQSAPLVSRNRAIQRRRQQNPRGGPLNRVAHSPRPAPDSGVPRLHSAKAKLSAHPPVAWSYTRQSFSPGDDSPTPQEREDKQEEDLRTSVARAILHIFQNTGDVIGWDSLCRSPQGLVMKEGKT